MLTCVGQPANQGTDDHDYDDDDDNISKALWAERIFEFTKVGSIDSETRDKKCRKEFRFKQTITGLILTSSRTLKFE